jgi:WD40 repeat protein
MTQVIFSQDGAKLAVFCHLCSGSFIFIMNAKTGGPLATIPVQGALGAVSPDLKYYITVKVDADFSLWDLESGLLIGDFNGPSVTLGEDNGWSWPRDYLFNPDETIIAVYSGSHIRLWDLHTGALLREIISPFGIGSLSFSPDGRLLAATGGGTVNVWGIK